ncbi:hypothetical protein M011DRAFT_480362 [Sporormia fimetaria CBS 119925]|uniref:Uncharacterized protein n=1 Tax=Sporormia fimetaria CBS 119925 TaxID=1340428 RepID=A0A6A6V061_9PLEO|nr:hypothetical protein M011DRAFT_480362 [Sporormia fimetaria CBS 119925]
MSAECDSSSGPTVRFKRRKLAHPRRVPTSENAHSPNATSELPIEQEDDPVVDIKSIVRQRRRRNPQIPDIPREQQAMAVELHKPEEPEASYSSRFVAQTGQIIDRDDAQMAAFVEARLAEQNHERYGWPIPPHLQALVDTMSREKKAESASASQSTQTPQEARVAAGRGTLQEVELDTEAAAQKRDASAKSHKQAEGNTRPRRRNRRNSEDVRRDKLVEDVLREAKLDFFEQEKPSSPPEGGAEDADEVFYEQFRREYESQEASRNQRNKPPPAGPKGVKEPSKGPKLGGSRSARAAMRLQEEQAAKGKR